jgi:hypothetical protein
VLQKALAKSPAIFYTEKVWIVVPALVSVKVQFPSPDHAVASVQEFKGGEGVKTICYLLFSPDITSAYLFLHQRVKSELAGVLFYQKSSKTSCDGVIRNFAKTSPPVPFGSRGTAAKSSI